MAAPSIVTCPHCGTKNRVPPVAQGIPRCGSCHNPLPWVVDADAGDFDAAIRADVPVIVDFWAGWCAPCRMLSPIVERVGRDLAGRLKVVKLDVDAAPQIGARYEAQSIPLLVLFRAGEPVDRLVGAVPERQLRAGLDPHL